MTSKLSIQEIRSLPKIDLHRHLDCSMRWSTLLEIATTLRLDFPKEYSKQRSHFLITEPMSNLESVLNKFLIAQKVLASEEILERLAFEACEDAFNDGVHILELRYAPTFIADGHLNLNFNTIHQAFLRGISRAQSKFKMAVGLICILQRTLAFEKINFVTDFAIENKDSFLALDLADNEVHFEPRKYESLFSKARKNGLHITIHSGETPSPESGQRIRDSIEILGAERIGHGVQVIHFPEVMNLVRLNDILLEICPYSNYLTQSFSNYEQHPLRKLIDHEIKVSICSDDPGLFASTLTDDFIIAQNYQKLNLNHFKRIYKDSYEKSFISQDQKSLVKSF